MASIFEELMSVNSNLTESVRPSVRGKKVESKKIPFKNLKVESVKVFEDADFDDLDQQFGAQPTEENPDEVVLVIDPEIQSGDEIPEDAAEKMVGDMVYKCPVCGSNYVCGCDPEMQEGIELDDEGVPVECPICGDDAEQILVGEIAPAEDAGEKKEPELVDTEDEEEEEEVPESEEVEEESLKENKTVTKESDEIVPQVKIFRASEHAPRVGDLPDEQYTYATIEHPVLGTFIVSTGINGDVRVDGKPWTFLNRSKDKLTDDQIKWVKGHEDDLRKFIVDGDYTTTINDNEEVVEDFECPECEDNVTELATPEEVKEETPAVQVKDSQVTLVLDDKRFESLMNQVISENYKNNPKFKINRCFVKEGKLRIQYTVTEGKSSKKGLMVAEGFDKKSRKMTLKFKDKGAFTESFSRTPSFVIECVKFKNEVIPTSVNYDYKVKVNESLYRVNGSVKSGK